MTARPTDEQLTAYVLGELSVPAQAAVERALAASPELRAEAEALRRACAFLHGELRGEPSAPLGGDARQGRNHQFNLGTTRRQALLAALDSELQESPARAGSSWRRRQWPVTILAAAAAAALIVYPVLKRHGSFGDGTAPRPKAESAAPNATTANLKKANGAPREAEASRDTEANRAPGEPRRAAANEFAEEKSTDSSDVRAADKLSPAPKAPAPQLASNKIAMAPSVSAEKAKDQKSKRAKASSAHVEESEAQLAEAKPQARKPETKVGGSLSGGGLAGSGLASSNAAAAGAPSAAAADGALTPPAGAAAVAPVAAQAEPDAAEPATYPDVRRTLGTGHLPDKHSVRVGALVNFFAYTYPNLSVDGDVAGVADVSAAPWNGGHKLVRLTLTTRVPAKLDVAADAGAQSFHPVAGSVRASLAAGAKTTLLFEVVPQVVLKPGAKGSLLTIHVRYGAGQDLLVPVNDTGTTLQDASDDQRFAAAVAEFGLLLKGTAGPGASWQAALDLAQGAVGEDPGGFRRDLVLQIKRAAQLAGP